MAAAASVTGAQAQCTVTNTAPFVFTSGATSKPLALGGLISAQSSAVTSLVAATNAVNTAFLTQTSAFIGSPANPNPNQTFGGVWERGIGGEVTTKNTSTSSGSQTFLPTPAGFLGNSTGNCNTTTRVTYGGEQSGADLARLKLGDGETNVYFGVTAGYVGANGRDVSANGTQSTPSVATLNLATDFGGQFQVPFVGAYGALTRGGFFVDAQILGSFYQMELTSPSAGLFAQKLDGQGISVNANIGYHYDTGWNNFFIEPSGGVSWSRVQVDPLSVAGTFGLVNSPLVNSVFPNTTVQINDIDSVLGRIGVRVGTTQTFGNVVFTPFATGAVWHEFAGNVTATQSGLTNGIGNSVNGGGAIQPLVNTGTLSVSRVGTYGQVGGGFAWQVLGTGWLGYIRADYRDGADIQALGFNGGVRYQFDPDPVAPGGFFKTPVKAPIAGVQPVNWSGFYVGAFLGSGWGRTDWTFVPLGSQTSPSMAGFLGGGEIGWNYQIGSVVLGIESDLGLGGLFGGTACPNSGQAFGTASSAQGGAQTFSCNEALKWMGTATARIGYAWDRVLFFAKGGGAWMKDDYSATCNFGPIAAATAPPANCAATVITASDKRVGWTVGGGFEYAITRSWSAKAEYDFADFGTRREFFSDGEAADIRKTVSVVKIGTNYRFDWAPPAPLVTKY